MAVKGLNPAVAVKVTSMIQVNKLLETEKKFIRMETFLSENFYLHGDIFIRMEILEIFLAA